MVSGGGAIQMHASRVTATRTSKQMAYRADHLVASITPCMVAVIATVQFCVGFTGTLTPWRGGGFGMFASVDRSDYRFVAVSATDNTGVVHQVALPSERTGYVGPLTGTALIQAKTFPTQKRLRRIVDAVLRTDSVLSSSNGIESIPIRLRRSRYNAVLERLPQSDKVLEVIGTSTGVRPTPEIVAVSARVLRLDFDNTTRVVHFRTIGPVVTARMRTD